MYAIKGPGTAINAGLVVGDLVFVQIHPTVDNRSDVGNWQCALRKLASWSPASVVPGHGAFTPGNGTKPLVELDRYFETLRAKVKAVKDAGKSVEEIKKGIRVEFEAFGNWLREQAIPATAEQVYGELSANY